MQTSSPVLAIDNLSLEFPAYKNNVKALNGVTLHVNPGEIVGVVGESGSGKSVTAMLSMRLLPERSYRLPRAASACSAATCSQRLKRNC
jgi:peptide/nickel transport system ATP-binding protein